MSRPPSSPPRTLSQAEFQQLLQRAVDRHTTQGPRTFTVDELVEAGRDLGIDPQTVQLVYQEHQRELSRPPVRQRPFDSALTLHHSGDGMVLRIPPSWSSRWRAYLIPPVLGAIVAFLGAIGAPRLLSLGAGALAALASYLLIRAARTVRELRLFRDGSGMLVRVIGKRAKGIPLYAGQIHARVATREVHGQNGVHRYQVVALDHGTETHDLLSEYSAAEQAWAADEIERWLGR